MTLRDPQRAARNRAAIAQHLGPAADALLGALDARLDAAPDPDRALNSLERLLATPAGQALAPELADPDPRLLDAVLLILGVSQFFADTLATYPEAVELLRHAVTPNPLSADLVLELRAEADAAPNEAGVLRAFRRFRHLHMLRVGVNDVLGDKPLEETTRELARLADASVEVAMQVATRSIGRKFGTPATSTGEPARLAALAFGKLGGDELNYSSDIDLMFVYDRDGQTAGRGSSSITNADYFARVVGEVVRLLSSITDRGFAYRVDLRLRPDGARGPLARSLASTLSYYDARGRTWERQALIKVRACAGDPALGREFASQIEPFVYRKYFSFSEINEVKALKRRMEQRSTQDGADEFDVKTGLGGIRDIEYTVQFLQLLNGGDLPAVRQRNTLLALEALEIAGCLTGHETYVLSDAYRFLRKIEHRLQLLFDWQTHRLPSGAAELDLLARRMGYSARTPDPERAPVAQLKRPLLDENPAAILTTRPLLVEPLDQFLKDYHDKTTLDRLILNHLLHQTFTGETSGAEPEADLILGQPDEATIRGVLAPYPFRDPIAAYRNLARLAQEEVPFLSHRRCRHFLASIAPALLRELAVAADPDGALTNFERVTGSLGGKAVLYELFSFNPPSLRLYVDICSLSPFLCGILVNNPGMIDELLDTLVLDQPRGVGELRAELAELCRGASDPDPILHSFQDKELLRIGVRDLLNKDTIRETTAALSDLAEVVLGEVFALAESELTARHGTPRNPKGDICESAVLGLGKLGGREISFYSDLDLVLIYDQDGRTAGPKITTNFEYFSELAQLAARNLSRAGPLGKLYQVDMRLRPTGKSASLAVPLAEFKRYYASGGRTWERQALTRGRVVRGEAGFARVVTGTVRAAMLAHPWSAEIAEDIVQMRRKLDAQAGPHNLKRSPGGLLDIEFLVQLWQLRYGATRPQLLQANVWAALDAATEAELIDAMTASELRDAYTFLRTVEARLRVATGRASREWPAAGRGARQVGAADGASGSAVGIAACRDDGRRAGGIHAGGDVSSAGAILRAAPAVA